MDIQIIAIDVFTANMLIYILAIENQHVVDSWNLLKSLKKIMAISLHIVVGSVCMRKIIEVR
tara:strand:- start:1867 stop:2052 length:186 start_codon:yes stop_codon:yes gene_type:complete